MFCQPSRFLPITIFLLCCMAGCNAGTVKGPAGEDAGMDLVESDQSDNGQDDALVELDANDHAAIDLGGGEGVDSSVDSSDGFDAQVDRDPCEGITCSGHGQCVSSSGTATCQCEADYHPIGLACIKDCVGAACYEWPMTAANPERTSWTPEEVRGDLKVDWYRPIDPYVDNKVQVIAAAGMLFVSTSKGLYAFDAADGTQAWCYGTEMPLGNSPTYANGVLYVGGFDHKIHAIDAGDGTLKSGWTFLNAEAGFDTNPLVVNDASTGNQSVVFAGNRDGTFYALDGTTGALKWKYQTGGPIHFSAAYKNGVLYFASHDGYAYALNASDGSLAWKSGKFPGVGFDMYWPVIYSDTYGSSPTYGKDFVIFSGSMKGGWGWFDESDDYHAANFELYNGWTGACGPEGAEPYLWVSQTSTLQCDAIYDYFNNNPKWNSQPPWKRFVFILNRETGVEYTPYAPFNPSGHDGGGQGYKQPPIVGGDGVLYTRIGYLAGGNGGACGGIAGWKFGTRFISRPHEGDWASDEPAAFTGGGGLIYYGEGSFNHEGFGTIDISNPLGSNEFWLWGPALSLQGSDSKYLNLTLEGKFGGDNGVYSYMDGLLNHSPIPYQGRVYLINGNVLFALSPTGSASAPLPMVQNPSTQAGAMLPTTKADLKLKLEAEIQKMLSGKHLRPGFHDSGMWSGFNVHYYYPNVIPGNHIAEYFANPADTLYALAASLPHLSSGLQDQVKAFMQQEESDYPVESIANIGWRNGAKREAYDDTPEMTAQINLDNDDNSYISTTPKTRIKYPNPCCSSHVNLGDFPPDSFYGAWKYAQVFPGEAKRIFDAMKDKLPNATEVAWAGPDIPASPPSADSILTTYPYILNQYIAGYRGYLELEKLAGYTSDITQSTRYAEYYRLLNNLKIDNFSKDTPFGNGWDMNNTLNIARNFMFLVPELGEALNGSRILGDIQQTITEYQVLEPYWFVSKYNRSYCESYSPPLYDTPALFLARAYILKQPFSELVKYLDVPAFERGDLFYILDLVAALEAP